MVSDNAIGEGRVPRSAASTPQSKDGLSNREREIIALASRGASDKEIADALELSVATLRTYWVRVRDKLGAVNRTHAIAIAAVDRPTTPNDSEHARLVETLTRDRVAQWVWQGRLRQCVMDAFAMRTFGLPINDRPVSMERILSHVWAPDRARFERFLAQGFDLRPMTPIELRVGTPGDYRTLIRTINLACLAAPDSTLLLATTAVHVFA